MDRGLHNIKEYLMYDPDSGIFRWSQQTSSRAPIGSLAGTAFGRGDIGIRFGRRRYRAHQLAWLFVYGQWPSAAIDHKDGDFTNNRIENLRLCTQSQNLGNRRGHSRKGYFKGVTLRRSGRYEAAICLDYRQIYLGTYATAEEAARAYDAAAVEHFGEFARLNFPNEITSAV